MTIEEFDKIPDGHIFAQGFTVDGPEGCNMTTSGKDLKWLARKGYANDWAIYCHWAFHDYEWIERSGDKVTMKNNILKLVPCDEDVFSRYRV